VHIRTSWAVIPDHLGRGRSEATGRGVLGRSRTRTTAQARASLRVRKPGPSMARRERSVAACGSPVSQRRTFR